MEDKWDVSIDPVTTHDVEAAISHTKPSAKTLVGQYEKWQKQYESVWYYFRIILKNWPVWYFIKTTMCISVWYLF